MDLQEALSKLAVASARILGLEIAGTDMVVDAAGAPKVIEVNYSPGFRGLEKATGIDVATLIIQYATRKRRD
jgi:ribosomal protein S6--L-glutamate ligase